jgi:hypothetical protein
MPILSVRKVIYGDVKKKKLLRTIRKYKYEYHLDKKHENDVAVQRWVTDLSIWLAMEFIHFKPCVRGRNISRDGID